jgi:hypothetical protein
MYFPHRTDTHILKPFQVASDTPICLMYINVVGNSYSDELHVTPTSTLLTAIQPHVAEQVLGRARVAIAATLSSLDRASVSRALPLAAPSPSGIRKVCTNWQSRIRGGPQAALQQHPPYKSQSQIITGNYKTCPTMITHSTPDNSASEGDPQGDP